MFVGYLSDGVVFIVFWVGEDRDFLPLARYTHRSLLQSPTHLAHTKTVSLSLTNILLAGFLLPPTTVVSGDQASEWYRFVRLLQLRGNLILLLPYTNGHFLPQLSIVSLASRDTPRMIYDTMCIRLLRVGPPLPFSLDHSIRYICLLG